MSLVRVLGMIALFESNIQQVIKKLARSFSLDYRNMFTQTCTY